MWGHLPGLILFPCDFHRRVNEDSILAIQIFDQKKFKKKDQGFLGVINVRIGDVIELQMGGDGKFYQAGLRPSLK